MIAHRKFENAHRKGENNGVTKAPTIAEAEAALERAREVERARGTESSNGVKKTDFCLMFAFPGLGSAICK